MKNNILKIENVSKSFSYESEHNYILKDINAEFQQNKTYSFSGISGSGKSTLISLLVGLQSPSSGKVLFNNDDLNYFDKVKKQAFLSKNIGLVFQMPYLIEELTVLENIMIKEMINKDISQDHISQGYKLLDLIGLKSKANFIPSLLSGGEQQRVAIARAIYNQPSFLIADEPTSALDEKNRDIIIELFKECHKQWGMGVIIACHDPAISKTMDVKYELSSGSLNIL